MSSKRKGSIGKHLPAWDEKAMEINRADVAELVDARDLKCLATPERFHLFWKTRSRFRHQPAGTKRDLENIFWGPLMALTVDRLLAAMRTVRALHLHCRRIVLPQKHASFHARFVCRKSYRRFLSRQGYRQAIGQESRIASGETSRPPISILPARRIS